MNGSTILNGEKSDRHVTRIAYMKESALMIKLKVVECMRTELGLRM